MQLRVFCREPLSVHFGFITVRVFAGAKKCATDHVVSANSQL